MGLDMMLYKKKKSIRKKAQKYFNELPYEEYHDLEVGYWRKANQIHKWFVDNVQDGVDDCGYYKVEKAELDRLLRECVYILNNVKVEQGKICNGFHFEKDDDGNLIKIENYEEGEIITNPEICEDILPTHEGFFFGSYNYDEYYLYNIRQTIDILQEILHLVDFDKYDIYYHSSW